MQTASSLSKVSTVNCVIWWKPDATRPSLSVCVGVPLFPDTPPPPFSPLQVSIPSHPPPLKVQDVRMEWWWILLPAEVGKFSFIPNVGTGDGVGSGCSDGNRMYSFSFASTITDKCIKNDEYSVWCTWPLYAIPETDSCVYAKLPRLLRQIHDVGSLNVLFSKTVIESLYSSRLACVDMHVWILVRASWPWSDIVGPFQDHGCYRN